jgi:hypothetical protein
LNLERENLIHLDVRGLWTMVEEKQRLLVCIQETDEEISRCDAEFADRQEPDSPVLRRLGLEIHSLKREIGRSVRENVSFIEETLPFIDEIISVFTSNARPQCSYESIVKRQRPASNLIFESEVWP